MRKKVLISHKIPDEPLKKLEEDFELIWPDSIAFSREEILAIIPSCDVVIGVFGNPLDTELINAGLRLKLIANYGAGVDNIDVETATNAGIVVTNTPDAVTEPTAELAMGLIVDVARRISEFDRALRKKLINDWGVLNNWGTSLKGKTLGIIGLGAIGKALARRALAFGMKIIYHNRNKLDPAVEERFEAKYTDLENLLRNSDFVSLNVPLTSETKGMISSSELKLMKPDAFLINTSRGTVVRQDALIEALSKKEIAGAALDVFANEPEVPEALLKMPNVVVVPHIGSATTEARNDMSRHLAEIITDFFQGMKGLPVVNPGVWDSKNLRISKI